MFFLAVAPVLAALILFSIAVLRLLRQAHLPPIVDTEVSLHQRTSRVAWDLNGVQKAELLANERLGVLQSHRDDGGILASSDLIIVWAREFLDDDVLYDVVLRNVRRGISYFYILDRMHLQRFERLLQRLYADIPERRIVDESIQVAFVRSELTFNNFVLLAYGTERQRLYSSLIFDDRPFGWLQQDSTRANIVAARVKTLVATIALGQAGSLKRGSIDYVCVDEQIMDFRALGKQLAAQFEDDEPCSPEAATFSLKDVVARLIKLPADSVSKVLRLERTSPSVTRLKSR